MKKLTVLEKGISIFLCFLMLICLPFAWAIQVKNGANYVAKVLLLNASNLSQGITGLTNTSVQVYVVQSTGADANMTIINLSEVDSANMPGLYNLTLNSSYTNTTGGLVFRITNGTTTQPFYEKDEVVDNLASDIYSKLPSSFPGNFSAMNITSDGNVTTSSTGGGGASAADVWSYVTRTITGGHIDNVTSVTSTITLANNSILNSTQPDLYKTIRSSR